MRPAITKNTKPPTFLDLDKLNLICLQLNICVTKSADWNFDFRFYAGLPDVPKFKGHI